MKLSDLRGAALTYPGVGGTRDRTCPPGFHPVDVTADLGFGPAMFERAAQGLMSWQLHRDFGFAVEATDPRVVDGAEFLGRIGIGHARLDVPVRLVWVEETPTRVGFGYGTLPGHLECGEEAFLLELGGDGTVRFTVRSFSRGAAWYTKVAGPVTRIGQRLAIARYIRCLRRIAQRV